jgi:hypothetical protein
LNIIRWQSYLWLHFPFLSGSCSKGDANHVAAAQQLSFAFDLTSHNPSRRAGVEYSNVLVSVQMKHEGKPSVRKTSAPAIATGNFSQPSNSDNTFRVETLLDNQFYGFYSANASATITVYARARFKYGLATTRRYNIRVSCEAVLMHNRTVNNPSQIAYCPPR